MDEELKEVRLKIICFYFTAVIYLAVCPGHVMAAETRPAESVSTGARQINSAELTRIRCYQSPKYFVVAKDVTGLAGTDFLIKYKSNADENLPCSYVFENNDFEIKNDWAEYFAGLTDRFLILDSTTGPGPSGLIIWDLEKRKKVYQGSWAGPIKIRDDSIVYWTETGEATDNNCPERAQWESHGLGAAIETKVILDLSDFRISKTKETRCSPRQ